MLPQTYLYINKRPKGITIECKKQKNAYQQLKEIHTMLALKIDTNNKQNNTCFINTKAKKHKNQHSSKSLSLLNFMHVCKNPPLSFTHPHPNSLANNLHNLKRWIRKWGIVKLWCYQPLKSKPSYLMLKTCCKLVYSWPFLLPLHLKPNLSHLVTFRHMHCVEPLSWATLLTHATNIVHTPHKIT